ncbi:MAG: hypothetical protein MJE77_28380 [Proteobacteria bacterium]|nr:hypothetical protein [Pseudomonadota bacterium]
MAELKTVLGTNVDTTVFRKLRELDYVTSYSHRGRYYTLLELAEFDDRGLWWFRGVGFSKYGTLLATTEALVNTSESGCFARELEMVLQVGVDDALAKLVKQGHLAREKIAGRYLYYSTRTRSKRAQLTARRARGSTPSIERSIVDTDELSDELKAAIVLFFSLLDEQQRRLYAGLEALKLGRGGDRRIAGLLGLDTKTIARGRRELLRRDVDLERVGKEGGGRKPVEKKLRRSSPRSKRS